jgi:tRNA-dihydrouridine synthase C
MAQDPPAAARFFAGPLTVSGKSGERRVTFDAPLFLAPMEGVTEPCFRDLVISLGGVGGACTEFIRISQSAVPEKVIRRYLGAGPFGCPVGAQLMAPDEDFLAESALAAEAAGAAFLDLNFGCPAPVVFKKCAGSALLGRPELLGRIVARAAASTRLPVTAKMRAGVGDDTPLEENVLAAAEAGAALITLHARLKIHSYAHPADWSLISRAKAALVRAGHETPLIGNGGVESPDAAAAMLRETGCDGVMIGRGALSDPFVFRRARGEAGAAPKDAAAFALAYASALSSAYGDGRARARLKQLVRYLGAGGLFAGREEERARLLREESLHALLSWFRGITGPAAPEPEGADRRV